MNFEPKIRPASEEAGGDASWLPQCLGPIALVHVLFLGPVSDLVCVAMHCSVTPGLRPYTHDEPHV